jgi:hypothetical protein
MKREQLFSLQELEAERESAFRAGALACCEIVDTIVDIVEKKEGHALSLLRLKLEKVEASLMGFHMADLEKKLMIKALIFESDFAEELQERQSLGNSQQEKGEVK